MTFSQRLQRALTFANIMATLALFIALGGTSWAAKRIIISGKNIKNNSIQSVDIKNGTIDKGDLSKVAKQSLQGPEGIPGDLGPIGPRGDAAQIKSGFANRDIGRVLSPVGSTPNQGPGSPFAWHAYGNNLDGGVGAVELSSQDLDASSNTLLTLEQNGTGPVGPVDFNSNLSGMASLTLLHHGPVHSRAECQMYMTEAAGTGLQEMGEPIYVSSGVDKELLSVSVVGSKNLSATPAAPRTYNVLVQCRSADATGTGNDEWEFVKGNIAAYAASR